MIPIEPFDALALSLHHNPGVYALLVGSGLSRSAGIPTGWEITLDLVRRLGGLCGASDPTDWAAWFRKEFGKEPSYSEILDSLATTPSERRTILHSYIEPSEGDPARRPTKAHRAIANLVVDGTIRVIITTNFDRLIENALREVGIEPTVIAGEDALIGATPLNHARCTLIKLHGDYLDTRIKNTEGELGIYGPSINTMLDEIFDRFGVIVAGWSGEWDRALRDALMRAPTRRYPFYWIARGKIGRFSQDIIDHRGALVVPVADADSFFGRLADAINALQIASRPHPQSVELAVALAKRYCRGHDQTLEWAEFLLGETSRIRDFVAGSEYPTASPTPDLFNALIAKFISLTDVLRRACLVSGRWGTDDANKAIIRAIRSLCFRDQPMGGFTMWIDLRDFAAALCFYWALAGAVARDDFATVHSIMHAQFRNESGETTFVETLPLSRLGSIQWAALKDYERRRTPASDFVFNLFEMEISDAAIDSREAEDVFDQVELLITLEYAYLRSQAMSKDSTLWFATPMGRFIWKSGRRGIGQRLSDIARLPNDHPLLRARLLGGTPDSLKATISQVTEFVRQNPGLIW